MATFTQTQGTRTLVLTLSTLASGSYITSSAIDLTATIPLDVTLELTFMPNGAPTSNLQMLLFAQLSLDNTNFGTGGSSTNDEGQLQYIGACPAYATSTLHRKFFNLEGLPVARYLKLVVKNDLGVALSSGTVYMAAITGNG